MGCVIAGEGESVYWAHGKVHVLELSQSDNSKLLVESKQVESCEGCARLIGLASQILSWYLMVIIPSFFIKPLFSFLKTII